MQTPKDRSGNRYRTLLRGVLSAWLVALTPMVFSAGEERDTAARLEAVQNEIRELRARLAETEGRAGELQSKLAQTERKAGRVARDLEQTRGRLEERRGRLAELERDRERLRATLDEQRAALAKQLRLAHALGGEAQLKLLLNQQDPAALGRTLVYYDYLNRARTRRIKAADATLDELRDLEAELRTETAALKRLNSELQDEQAALEQARRQRRQVLTDLQAQIGVAGRELESLQADEEELQALLKSLREALDDIPEQANEDAPFDSLKGQLAWPVEGRLSGHFGQSRGRDDGAVWEGALIDAQQGEPVRAVSRGRVAFADWMRGFGLLMIVDHGRGYMSLYGHNQSLYHSTGEWVEAGERIGRVGDSGGRNASGLYFEIRRDGQPLDPAQWCATPAPPAG